MKRVKTFIRKLHKFIAKLIDYAPLLWRDWDGDYIYLLRLMRHKIYRMGYAMRRTSKKETEQMATVIALIDRIDKDEYAEDALRSHKEKWGELSCPVCGGFMCDCFPDRWGQGYYVVAIYDNAHTEALDNQARDEYMSIFNRAAQQRQHDIERVFSIISDNLLDWWY